MKKVLITGASGQLGASLQLNDYDVMRTDIIKQDDQYNFTILDITNEKQVKDLLEEEKPNVIVHLAAMTNVDGCERNPEQAQLINVQGTENLLNYFDGKFIFISSDYVFDGESDQPYIETDIPNPINVYGKTKLAGEKALQAVMPINAIIIRTSWVYSEYGNNFVKTMLRLGKERDEINIVSNQIGSPTYATDLAEVILAIVNNKDYQNKKIFITHAIVFCALHGAIEAE